MESPPSAGVPEDPFDPQGSGSERIDDGSMRQLAPERIQAERVAAWIAIFAMFVPLAVGLSLMWLLSDWSAGICLGVSLGSTLLLVTIGVLLYCWPPLEHRRTRWRLSSEGVDIQRGVIWRHSINVPRRRIQHTDVSQGPIQRRFDLGTLIMHTAGTHSYEIRLEGITFQTALEVRDSLLEKPQVSQPEPEQAPEEEPKPEPRPEPTAELQSPEGPELEATPDKEHDL